MLFSLVKPVKPLPRKRAITPSPVASSSKSRDAGSPNIGHTYFSPSAASTAIAYSPSRSTGASPSPSVPPSDVQEMSLSPLDSLKSLVQSMPPKSLHASLVSRLSNASPEQISALSQLLEGMAPPPHLHCARCHANYYDEDNMDRSCVMEHDDNSTDVQYGETTWGCCGQTVEGDGSDGPPAGWCYEGKHTDDRSKARYRDDYDSDASEDGLQSCKQRRCKRKAETQPASEPTKTIVTRRGGERLPPAKRKRI